MNRDEEPILKTNWNYIKIKTLNYKKLNKQTKKMLIRKWKTIIPLRHTQYM